MQTTRFSTRFIQHHGKRMLLVSGELPNGMQAEAHGADWVCPLNVHNAAVLRSALAWLAPMPVGLRKSIGCGDRLGIATTGHVDAVRTGEMFPVFAQQSIREMQRAGRTPQQVMDDATWGVLEAEYQNGWGCDADHLKTPQAIDDCIAAGFIGFTLDPGEYVDNTAHTDDEAALRVKFAALPWSQLETTPADFRSRYLASPSTPVADVNETAVLRAACKYGWALAHVVLLARHIAARLGSTPYDLEISVDETDTPTSAVEHYVIASELIRLNIPFTGLAPRFVGRFEKGVDYIGDLAAFEVDFAAHARIQQHFSRYKLSIHSGSDKFSLYPIIAQHANPYVHLKTAGTSWLEALRVIANCQPPLFRAMLAHASERYPQDMASYHVSAQLDQVPSGRADADLGTLLDDFHTRQILHVTFGSLLGHFREDIYTQLGRYQAEYRAGLKAHFIRHLAPFNLTGA
jgi:hypothetical protein